MVKWIDLSPAPTKENSTNLMSLSTARSVFLNVNAKSSALLSFRGSHEIRRIKASKCMLIKTTLPLVGLQKQLVDYWKGSEPVQRNVLFSTGVGKEVLLSFLESLRLMDRMSIFPSLCKQWSDLPTIAFVEFDGMMASVLLSQFFVFSCDRISFSRYRQKPEGLQHCHWVEPISFLEVDGISVIPFCFGTRSVDLQTKSHAVFSLFVSPPWRIFLGTASSAIWVISWVEEDWKPSGLDWEREGLSPRLAGFWQRGPLQEANSTSLRAKRMISALATSMTADPMKE